jgi:hypothetical protein
MATGSLGPVCGREVLDEVVGEAGDLAGGVTVEAEPGPLHAVKAFFGAHGIDDADFAVLPAGFEIVAAVLQDQDGIGRVAEDMGRCGVRLENRALRKRRRLFL